MTTQLLQRASQATVTLLCLLTIFIIEEELWNGTGVYDSCMRDRFDMEGTGGSVASRNPLANVWLGITFLCIALLYLLLIVERRPLKATVTRVSGPIQKPSSGSVPRAGFAARSGYVTVPGSRSVAAGFGSELGSPSVPTRWTLNLYALSLSLFALVWYLNSFGIMWILKQVLGDTTCSRHSNSVSGHYFMHFYYILTIIRFIWHIKGKEGQQLKMKQIPYNVQALLIDIVLILLLMCSLITLSFTWLLGYHSLRQILYGTFVGLLSHYGLTLALSNMESANFRAERASKLPTSTDDYKPEVIVLTNMAATLLAFHTIVGLLSLAYGRIPWSAVDIFILYLSWAGLILVWLCYYYLVCFSSESH